MKLGEVYTLFTFQSTQAASAATAVIALLVPLNNRSIAIGAAPAALVVFVNHGATIAH